MENEPRSCKLQQTKYTFMVYIGVDEAAALGWKKGDKLTKRIDSDGLHIAKDERFKEVPPEEQVAETKAAPIIAEVRGEGDDKVVASAVNDILKKVV